MTAFDKFKQDVDAKLASMTPQELQKVYEDAGVKFKKRKKKRKV